MHYTTLGRTGLRVSVAPASAPAASAGFGLKTGKTEEEAARLDRRGRGARHQLHRHRAALWHGRRGGPGAKSIPRQSVVIATKVPIHRGDEWWPAERVVESLDNSLRLMGTDHVDVFNLHGVEADEYDHALNNIVPPLLEQKAK
jgi:L-galactose dehydrogenase